MTSDPGRPLDAVLVRHHHVLVRNISQGGGLLEMRTPLGDGAVGLLEIELQGGSRTERFRVCRVTRIEGAGVFHVAVEFLSMAAAADAPVRGALTARELADASAALAVGTRALSGWVLTSSEAREVPNGAGDVETGGNSEILRFRPPRRQTTAMASQLLFEGSRERQRPERPSANRARRAVRQGTGTRTGISPFLVIRVPDAMGWIDEFQSPDPAGGILHS